MNKHDELIERGEKFIGDGNYMLPDEEDCMRDLIAELKRKDAVIERLGSNELLIDLRTLVGDEQSATVAAFDCAERIQYARDNRYPK